jgi:PP-loop superfamily ATP-utilizing enzyme
MQRCTRCILPESYSNITFDKQTGTCNYCSSFKKFVPIGEEALKSIFKKTQKKKKRYDVLVPFSGGKDSAYILYLASKVYKLNVLAYTYDNGFFSELALENINKCIENTNVDHIFYRPNNELMYKGYRTALINSGEICGVCGIGITNSIHKISSDWDIPLILMGHSPIEDNSFTGENLYDVKRLRTILKDSKTLTDKEIQQYLIYPDFNYISTYILTKLGKFGKKINVLYYLDNPTDKEIAEILTRELGWMDKSDKEFSKHFDCWAEPFTNYVRDHRFGHSRRISQLSNMVRIGELTREKAIEIHETDKAATEPENFEKVLNSLKITRKDLDAVFLIDSNKYSKYVSKANLVFEKMRNLIIKD